MSADLYIVRAKPQVGKTAFLTLLSANLAADLSGTGVLHCPFKGSLNSATGEVLFGVNAKDQAVVGGIWHAGEAEEAEPVGGVANVKVAGHSVGKAGAFHPAIKDVEFLGDGDNAGVVANDAGLIGIELDHGFEVGGGDGVCNSEPGGVA